MAAAARRAPCGHVAGRAMLVTNGERSRTAAAAPDYVRGAGRRQCRCSSLSTGPAVHAGPGRPFSFPPDRATLRPSRSELSCAGASSQPTSGRSHPCPELRLNRRTLVSTAAKYVVAVLAVVAVSAFRLAFVNILGDR